MKRILLFSALALSLGVSAQSTGDYQFLRKLSSGFATDFVTPSSTGLLTTDGGSPNKVTTIARSTFALAAHNQAWSTITSTPTTISGYGITDLNSLGDARWSLTSHTHAQSDVTGLVSALAGKQATITTGTTAQYFKGDLSLATFPTSNASFTNGAGYLTAAVTSVTAGTGLSGGAITTTGTVSMPNTGTAGTYSGTTTDAQGRVTSGTTRSFTNNASRTIQTVAASANGWQISSTRDSHVSYAVTVSCAVQIGVVTNVEGYVAIEVAATNSSTAGDWQEVGRMTNGQNISLALALATTVKVGGMLTGLVPAGFYVRIRSVNTSGTPTFSYISGQEVIL